MRFILLPIAIVFAFPAEAAEYKITKILSISEATYENVAVSRLNDLGQVVGQIYNGADATAFMWEDANGLSWISGPNQSFSAAGDINNFGQVVGQSGDKAFIWSASAGFQYLKSPSQRDGGSALVINDAGQISGYVTFADGRMNAAVWDSPNARASVVGAPATSLFSGGGAGGMMAGYQYHNYVGFNDIEAMVWTETDGTVALGTLGASPGPGASFPKEYSNARDLNISGVVVGYSSAPDGERAFWWTKESGMSSLTDLAGGKVFSRARSINNIGQVVGFGSDDVGMKAVLWNSVSGEAIDLNSYVSPNLGWVLTEANDINQLGQIAGSGVDATGNRFAWIMSPIEGVPEPAAWALMLGGFGIVGCSLRGRRSSTALVRT